jgi:sugar/nucleoside kinase (ribokinase family)
MTERDLDLAYVFNAKHLHVSSYFLQKGLRASLINIFRKAKEAGLTTSLDTNDDPENRWAAEIQLLLKYTDILLPNEREACKLAQVEDLDRAADILSQKVPTLVIKRGSQGAIARSGRTNLSIFRRWIWPTRWGRATVSMPTTFTNSFAAQRQKIA